MTSLGGINAKPSTKAKEIDVTEEQFIEEVRIALDKHVSRDYSISSDDREWETVNLAARLSARLRLWVPQIPHVTPAE